MINNNPMSLEDLSRLGEKYYTEELKDTLEKEHMGEFAVIDVEQKKFKVNSDRLAAIEEAKREFGDKLFFIVQIGSTQSPNRNFSAQKYAWNF